MAAKLLSANPREISEDDLIIARSATDAEIPTIDFAPFLSGSPADRRRVAEEIARACESIGFFTLVGHSVPAELMRRIFEQSAHFYAAPAEVRRSVAATNDWFRGWIAQPAAATAANNSQMFEQFRFQAEWEPLEGEGARYNHLYNLPMKWPAALPGFRETCVEYLEAGSRLGGALLHAFAMGLGLPEDRFDRYFEKPVTQANLLYYLPLPEDADPAMSNIVAHTDSPPLTILAQDSNGGLEVCRRDGGWITAPPVENAFTVNVGNMMMWWSHGRYVSTLHRVKNRRGRVRYSIPMFVVPDRRVVVEPLPELAGTGPTSDFPPVLVGEHMAQYYKLRDPRPAARG
jgi:isopenicillin N synthase-like dioxygenase